MLLPNRLKNRPKRHKNGGFRAKPLAKSRRSFLLFAFGKQIFSPAGALICLFGNAKLRRMLLHRRKTFDIRDHSRSAMR